MSEAPNPHPSDSGTILERLDRVIAADPTNAMWHWRRGVTLAAADDFPHAREALEKAISLLPRYADAWVSLGGVHVKMGDRKSAKRAFRSAADIEPLTEGAIAGYLSNAWLPEFAVWGIKTAIQGYWRKLRRRTQCADATQTVQEAINFGDRRHYAAAIDVLRRGLARCPGYVPFAKYLGAYLVMHGNRQQSRQLLEKMVAWWPEDPQTHLALGVCLSALGDVPAASAVLKRALALDPGNHDIQVALSAIGAAPPPAPNLIETRNVFDNYAEHFDSDLVRGLDYRVPEKLAAIFAERGRVWDRMLDLGCGTGLTGVSLRPYTRHLTGVDLSRAMIDKAKARGVYDMMYQGDCVAFLQQIDATYDLMVATDVLVYFGDLANLFRAARVRLVPGGVFWFSVEEWGGEGYVQQLTRRYQHSLSYIRATAHTTNLRPVFEQQIDIRLENRRPVRGLLVALERTDDFSEDKSWQFQPGSTPSGAAST